jgi:hypothetical protein
MFLEGCGQVSDIEYMSVGSGATLGVFGVKRVGGHAVHSIRFPTLGELWKVQLPLPTTAVPENLSSLTFFSSGR